MTRPLFFLAMTLAAATGATAQAPIGVTGGGSPVVVQPIQIGPNNSSGPADRQRAPDQGQATQPPSPRTAPPPMPLSTCSAGGCWDSQGNRYNGTGDGSRLISPEGRPCQANGKFIHCN